MSDKGMIVTGMAEVSVKELVALEKSVSDKDQLVGALREQVKQLEADKVEIKKDAAAKQAQVLVRKGVRNGITTQCSCGYYHDNPDACPRCGRARTDNKEAVEYRNLDSVIEDIRKETITKLGIDVAGYEQKINDLNLEKSKLQNDLSFKLSQLEETLKTERKEKESDIQKAKDKIRKHMADMIDPLNDEIEELQEELKKVKKDKTDVAVEEARKQEIIDLKERINELENAKNKPIQLGWFKQMIYNWLKIDGEIEVAAEVKLQEKKARIDKISRQYPTEKSFWTPGWMKDSISWSFGLDW